ncbi:hypothetical protein [Mariprofundus ferrooxydans]|uniref:hypothetical protein n=1 Tax=Mariprofundus ferrooxydans TaxID=314344 RepID=UPI00037AD552|nr:hypothetical protein [Mariprofundus ferrooxydans]
MTTQTLSQIIQDAKDELEANYESYDYPEDLVHELADAAVPIYNSHLFELATANPELAEEGELGPASGSNFSGAPMAIRIIAGSVYERISDELHQHLLELQHEQFEREAA